MIQIRQDEAMAIRQKYGNSISITITSRRKKGSAKKYYVEESRRVFFFLERYRAKKNSPASVPAERGAT